MGADGKYGRVTTEHGTIPDDEPVIVFRARDRLTPEVIEHYAQLCGQAGSPDFHVSRVLSAARSFRQWQQEHPDQVRTPDSAAHQQRLGS